MTIYRKDALSGATINGIRDVVRQYYEMKGEGRIVCPVCVGGSDAEQCMTIYTGGDGALLATCHRDHCPVGTVVACSGAYFDRTVTAVDNSKQTPYIHGEELSDDTRHDYFEAKYRFEFHPKHLQEHVKEGANCTIWPMRAYNGDEKGAIVRPFTGATKSLTYKYDPNYDGMSWYRDTRALANAAVFVVEDCVSALAMYQMRGCAVSLNGTNLNEHRMDEMLRHKWQVVLMLDADATTKALQYCAKYGPDVLRVVRLVRDIKNMSTDAVEQLLYREGL